MAYKKILVPVDGSAISARGLKEAVRMCRGSPAKLCLVHVVEAQQAVVVPEVGTEIVPVLDALKQAGRRTLAKAEATVRRSGLKSEIKLVEDYAGPTSDAIVRQARRFHADLIVMGTHARRGVARALLGSDAELVVRKSPVPVLLVPDRR
jgi:nucleotide-binding universal stress UspA family protein